MQCFDHNTNVDYGCHEEFVVQTSGGQMQALGFCVRCGAISDEKLCRTLAARGNERCQDALRSAGIAWMTAEDKAADAAFAKLSDSQRAAFRRRNS